MPTTTTASTKRATLTEVKQFANKVRAAGGGNPIDALIPAVPEDPSQCLIARNLNFNCQVGDYYEGTGTGDWWMTVDNIETGQKIAQTLGLTGKIVGKTIYDRRYAILLPKKIGQVAADFDQSSGLLAELQGYIEEGLSKRTAWDKFNKLQKKLMRDMAPYIESARTEAYGLTDVITPDGKIVIR